MVVSSAVKVAQFIGRYIRLMEAFPDCGLALLLGIGQVFDFYCYTACVLFSVNPAMLFRRSWGLEASQSGGLGRPQSGGFDTSRASVTSSSSQSGLFYDKSAPSGLREYPSLVEMCQRVKDSMDSGQFGSSILFSGKNIKNQQPPKPPPLPPSPSALTSGLTSGLTSITLGGRSSIIQPRASEPESISKNAANMARAATDTTQASDAAAVAGSSYGSASPPAVAAAAGLAGIAAGLASRVKSSGLLSPSSRRAVAPSSRRRAKVAHNATPSLKRDPSDYSPRAAAAAAAATGYSRASSLFGSLVGGTSSAAIQAANALAPPRMPSIVRLNSKVDLKSRMNSAGYNERLNSAESVVFIVRCLRAMDRRLRKAAKASGPDVEERLTVFQKYTYNICFELRKLMYRTTSALFIDTRGLKKGVGSCNWNMNELTSRNNGYVDLLVSHFKDSLAVVGAHGALPLHIERLALREAVRHMMESLVALYGSIKKCTTEGRASMSLDLNVLKSQIERLCPQHLRPLPQWQYVMDFVKAYYLPEDDLCKWVASHPSYSLSQYRNLASVGPGAGMRSKRREKLLGRIEAVFRGGEFARKLRAMEAERKQQDKVFEAY